MSRRGARSMPARHGVVRAAGAWIRMMRRPAIASALALACVATMAIAATPVLQNGSFTESTEGVPTAWKIEAWSLELSQFTWEPNAAPDGRGAIRITSPSPNDARWCQTVTVEAGGVYRITGLVKTSDVGTATAGAFLVIEPRVGFSPDIRGTADWQRLEVVAQAGEHITWEVCARLGSYSSLNTGTAWFSDIALEELRPGTPPVRFWQVWEMWPKDTTWSATPWSAIVLPLVAGGFLAFGLGVIGRPRSWDR